MQPKIIVFASGTAEGGGSGFENLVASGALDADIVAAVSTHAEGGVRERANRLGMPFILMRPPFSADAYRQIVEESGAEWVALSGWLQFARGLDPRRTFNIHPALLSALSGRFGGKGMYGHHVHEAVAAALAAGEIAESGPAMHFVTDEYDRGPVFFEKRIPLARGASAEEIAAAVNRVEHELQPRITNLVVHGEIAWDGEDPKTLRVPADYPYLP